MNKKIRIISYILALMILMSGCSSGDKYPFSGLSAGTTRKEISRKYPIERGSEEEDYDWSDTVSFLGYKGYMRFDYNGSDDPGSRLKEAVWYFDTEKDDAVIADVVSAIYSYYMDTDGFSYDRSGSSGNFTWYVWTDTKGGSYSLYDYGLDSPFVLYDPMG